MPKSYTATVVIMPPASDNVGLNPGSMLQSIGVPSFLLGGATDKTSKFIAILKSQTLANTIIKKFNLKKEYEIESYEEATQAFQSNLIYLIGDESQIYISFTDKNQDNVANITNKIVSVLDSINIQLSIKKAHEARRFIEDRFNIILDSLTILENNLQHFREEHKLFGLEDQIATEVQRAAALQADIMLKKVQLDVLKKSQQPESPEIKQLELEISIFQKEFDKFFFKQDNSKIFININNIPELQQNSMVFKRKLEYFKKLAEYLGPQYEQAKINEAKKISTLQVLDQAKRPEKKSKPRRALIVIGGVLFAMMVTWASVILKISLRQYQATTNIM